MLFTSRIAGLQAELAAALANFTALTGERDQLLLDVSGLQEANDAFSASDAAHLANVAALTAERAQLATANADLTTRLAAVETTIESKVIERIATAGVPAIARVDSPELADRKGQTPKQRLAASFNSKLAK